MNRTYRNNPPQASKSSRSEAQLEQERKRKEYRQEILRKHGATSAATVPSSKRQKTGSGGTAGADKPLTSSAFQDLFAQRAQGFQIDFRFRNAPPRPPVGPCFVGHSLATVLLEHSRTYKPQNAVEIHHTWKLHSEPDIGVPLAPSAMNLKSYDKVNESVVLTDNAALHPDDAALLDWTGSLGDTAAENWKRRQEKARAAARLAASGRAPPPKIGGVTFSPQQPQQQSQQPGKKKAFSRVLKEEHQTWMKKTTYLSNDYSRKVHDFKSLAQTKSELAVDLEAKQKEMTQRRSVQAIASSFGVHQKNPPVHPTNPALKPLKIMPVLPYVANWGRAFTHVVVDKAPINIPEQHTVQDLKAAFLTNVEKRQASSKMTCQMIVPSVQQDNGGNNDENVIAASLYDPIQAYDLDVIPLKDEDSPHVNFCFWLEEKQDDGGGVARYVPVASRVQLSTGRPVLRAVPRKVERRPVSEVERKAMEVRMADVDKDMAEKYNLKQQPRGAKRPMTFENNEPAVNKRKNDSDEDGAGDFGYDDSSSDEEVFGIGAKTIVAES